MDNENKNQEFPEQGNFSASPDNFKNNYNAIKQNQIKQNINKGNINQNPTGNGINPRGNFPNNGQKLNQGQQNQSNQQDMNPIEEKVIKEGAKTAANAVAGPVGGAAVDALSKTELGKKAMQGISQAAKNPLGNPLKKPGLSKLFDKKEKNEQEEGEGDYTTKLGNNIIKFGSISAMGFGGCLSFIIIIVLIAIILSPLIFMNDIMGKLSNSFGTFGDKLGNFLTFNGWCTDEECELNQKIDFYDEIKNVYDDYLNNYGVSLDVNLITATLTYADPFITEDDENVTNENGEFDFDLLLPSGHVDFKKSKKKIEELAENMISECCYDYDKEYYVCAEYPEEKPSCPPPSTEEETEEGEEEKEEEEKRENKWELDIERYKNYLKDGFIRKFYFNNDESEDTNLKVERAIEDIFSRVELFERMNDSTKSDILVLNTVNVTLLDCNNGLPIADVPLYDYLQGVLYLEGFATARSEEFLKVMAIAAKNYLYAANGATVDSIPNNLTIRSCQMNQIYCSVKEGCHNMEDGGGNQNYNTIAPGPNADGEYHLAPLTNVETLEKIKSAVDSTFNEFIVKDGRFVATQYRSQCNTLTCDSTTNIMDQLKAHQMVNEGKTYTEVLNYFYNGNIETHNINNAIGYPLDLENNYVTSAFGWRVHPINKNCSHHYGTDIGANYDDNIYSIADGVITLNDFHYSYGNRVIIGHGAFDEATQTYEYYSLYAHQIRESFVEVGREVVAGEKIGNVGSTGTSTGPHLHIEIFTIENGKWKRQDAVEYFKGIELQGFVGGAIYDSEADCLKCLADAKECKK